ncbi:MAG: DUF308 domain-containing protein [Candidatus Promineofilum sp.]|nr:DUF308 domain-containing protein [Promineifilum sp.]
MTKYNGKSANVWLWTIIRGLIALVLGLYLLVGANSSAPLLVGYALAGYLTVSGAIQTFSSIFNRDAPGSGTDRLRGLVGFVGGGVLLLLAYFDILSPSASYIVLAVLLIAYGALGLFEVLFDRGPKSFSWMPLIINLLLVALGVLAFVFRARELNLLTWAGALLSVIGLALLIYGYFIQKRSSPTAAVGV